MAEGYTVQGNRCKCHPETCACPPWYVLKDGERFLSAFTRAAADAAAHALNAAAGVHAPCADHSGDSADMVPRSRLNAVEAELTEAKRELNRVREVARPYIEAAFSSTGHPPAEAEKVIAGVKVDRTALWDAIAELVVACGGSAAHFDEGIADRIDAAARGVLGTFEGGGGQGKEGGRG